MHACTHEEPLSFRWRSSIVSRTALSTADLIASCASLSPRLLRTKAAASFFQKKKCGRDWVRMYSQIWLRQQ